jgi:hypothetical protein
MKCCQQTVCTSWNAHPEIAQIKQRSAVQQNCHDVERLLARACAGLGAEGTLVGGAQEDVSLNGVGQHNVAEVGELAEAEDGRRRIQLPPQRSQRLITCANKFVALWTR